MKNLSVVMVLSLIICASGTTNAQALISTPPESGWYMIKVAQTGKVLSVNGSSADNGARIIQSDWINKDNQKFYVSKQADGLYTFMANHSQKYIAANYGDSREGDAVIQNVLQQYFGKWRLRFEVLGGCAQGFQILYNTSEMPIQLIEKDGLNFELRRQQYQDGAFDCAYTFLFEKIEAPLYRAEKAKRVPINIKRNN